MAKLRSLRTLRLTSGVFLASRSASTNRRRRVTMKQGGPADPGGSEPVVLLALVEDDLEAAGPDDESGQSRGCRSGGTLAFLM